MKTSWRQKFPTVWWSAGMVTPQAVASSPGSLLPPEVNWAKAGGSLGSEITWLWTVLMNVGVWESGYARLLHIDERAMYMYRTQPARMSLHCQLPASCALAWAVQQFSDRRAHAQSTFHLRLERITWFRSPWGSLPRPALAQFTSGGRREPGDEATQADRSVCMLKRSIVRVVSLLPTWKTKQNMITEQTEYMDTFLDMSTIML